MIRNVRIVALGLLLLWQHSAFAAAEAVTVEASFIGEYVENTSGGVLQDSLMHDTADLAITLDTEAAHMWDGGTFFMELLYNHGDDPSAFIGDTQTASNIADGKRSRLQQLWFDQAIGDNVSFLIGLHDLNSEFDASEYGALFLNSSFGIGPEISGNVGTSLWPEAGMATRLSIHNDNSYLKVAVYDGDPATRKVDEAAEGLMTIGEAAWLNGDAAYKIGAWQHSADKVAPDGKVYSQDTGIYTVIDQPINDRIGVFLQLGYADKDRNDIESYVGAGVVVAGPIPGRADDTFGLAVARANFSSVSQTANNIGAAETAIELTYDITITDWLNIHPAYQIIQNPGGDTTLTDAGVGMLRVDIHLP